MKLLVGLALLSAIGFVKADHDLDHDHDDDDVQFLTKLVNDYKDHTKDYLQFVRTASSVPDQFSSLALEVATYTDDSYTTLLDDVDIDPLESFASEFPWHTRLEADDSDDDSDDESSGSANAAAASTSGSDSSESSASDSDDDSSSSSDGAGSLVAPVGAVLGAIGVALL